MSIVFSRKWFSPGVEDLEKYVKRHSHLPIKINESIEVDDFSFLIIGKNHSYLAMESNYRRIQKKAILITGDHCPYFGPI